MARLKTIEVIQDGIPATFEKLRAHYPGTLVELHAINRNDIVVEVDKRPIKLKYLSTYYLIHNQFGEPGLVESTEPIEWVINMVQRKADKVYARLETEYDNVLDIARRHQETIITLKEELSKSNKFFPSPEAILADAQHYVGELNVEVMLPQSEAPDFELHTIALKVVPYYNDKLGLQVTKNVTFNETGLIDTSDFLIFDIPKDLSIDALISKINYQYGDFNKVTDLTDSERKCLRYSRIWDGISKMRQNNKALTFVLTEPDPEPSVAGQEVMQNEVNEAREIVNVYVRLRIKFIHRKKVQVLELVNTIYYGVLHSGQEVVDDIPFNIDIHTVVKDLNTRNCLMPRTDPDKSIKIFPNFTSYAQEVYRDGKVVQLVIGEPMESTPQTETDTVVQDGSLMFVYVGVINDGNGYRSLYLTQGIRDTDDNGDVMYLPTNSHIVKKIGLTDDLDDVILQLNNLYCTKRPDQYSFLLKPAFQGFASRKRKQGYGVVLIMLED